MYPDHDKVSDTVHFLRVTMRYKCSVLMSVCRCCLRDKTKQQQQPGRYEILRENHAQKEINVSAVGAGDSGWQPAAARRMRTRREARGMRMRHIQSILPLMLNIKGRIIRIWERSDLRCHSAQT